MTALDDFYGDRDEAPRLTSREGVVEFLRTQRLLRAALPAPPARVLDVGGADGVHAQWLREDGHDVTLVDPVAKHVQAAGAKGIHAEVGDARALSQANCAVDAVLLLGPLYHLQDASDRRRALEEAHRVLRPGGLLAAAAISRLSAPLDVLRKGRYGDPTSVAASTRVVEAGLNDTGRWLNIFYFHTAGELRLELEGSGFTDVQVRGLEGPAWPLIPDGCSADDPLVAHVLAIADLADADPAAVGASAHLLALGTPA